MSKHRWVAEVLIDIADYAEMNGLGKLKRPVHSALAAYFAEEAEHEHSLISPSGVDLSNVHCLGCSEHAHRTDPTRKIRTTIRQCE